MALITEQERSDLLKLVERLDRCVDPWCALRRLLVGSKGRLGVMVAVHGEPPLDRHSADRRERRDMAATKFRAGSVLA